MARDGSLLFRFTDSEAAAAVLHASADLTEAGSDASGSSCSNGSSGVDGPEVPAAACGSSRPGRASVQHSTADVNDSMPQNQDQSLQPPGRQYDTAAHPAASDQSWQPGQQNGAEAHPTAPDQSFQPPGQQNGAAAHPAAPDPAAGRPPNGNVDFLRLGSDADAPRLSAQQQYLERRKAQAVSDQHQQSGAGRSGSQSNMSPGLGGGSEAAVAAAAAVQMLEQQAAESRGGLKLVARAQAAAVPTGSAILQRQRLTAEHSPAMELLAAYSGLATKGQLPQALAVVEAFLAASRFDVLDRWASQLHIRRAC